MEEMAVCGGRLLEVVVCLCCELLLDEQRSFGVVVCRSLIMYGCLARWRAVHWVI